jgi:NADPH-dependent 2,4-dienoyl-CoA reductase/sulfur reductase-like enzyme
MDRCDLLVVGAGPAGIAAAAEASRHGLSVVVVDPREHAGGQYYARPAPGRPFAGLPPTLTSGLEPARVAFWGESEVWGAFGELFAVTTPAGSRFVAPAAAVIATGAVERPQPFPGWDQPSVMSAGAAQLLLKEQGVLAEGGIVVAGSGPFLVAVAGQLHEAGARVTALVEATPRNVLMRRLPPVLLSSLLAQETLRLAWQVRGIRRLFGVRVSRKHDDGVVLSDGREVGCDLLCVGNGFSPRLSLAQLLDCRVGSAGIVVDADMRTSRPSVFAAGEVTGIAGARVAAVEGRVAGLVVVADRLGRLSPEHERRRRHLQRQRTQLRHTAARLLDAYAPFEPLALATDETIICRCEGVALGQVRGARLATPPADGTRALKALLRCGMGPCQGLFCRESVAAALGESTVPDPGTEVRVRPPIGAVSVGEVARLDLPG